MQYRDFGQLDFRPSALGFGAMRLPVLMDDDGKPDFKRIDYPLATEMLHRAIDGGVNYVDTAWMYHEDNCEAWLGRGAQGRLPRAGQARHQDARVERREAV